MMVKLSPAEAELLASILESGAAPESHYVAAITRRIATQIRARLETPPAPLDAVGYAPPAGAILPPHHRASHWRYPIPGIDERTEPT